MKMTSTSIARSVPFIKIMIKSKSSVDKGDLLRKFPSFVIDDIAQILRDVVLKRIPIRKRYVKALQAHKKPLLKLAKLKNKKGRSKLIYKQKGGFIAGILPIIASLIGGIAANAF